MEFLNEDHATDLLQAQTHVYNHVFSFIKPMSLKCAVELCIPDIIHKYGQPMPLKQLVASLPSIHPSKTRCIYRLMRILTHYGFFITQQNVSENDELDVKYELTDSSKLLLKDHPFSLTSFLKIFDPVLVNPWYQLSTWFENEDPSPFHTEHGVAFWDYLGKDPRFNHTFNAAMANDARLVSAAVMEKFSAVFKGFETLVDVGGGKGTIAKAIAQSFPQLECIVFDLLQVVDGLEGNQNLRYVGGDMFEAIPSTDSILLKWILHDWNDEECLKILKKCKEAITSNGKEGKVIIIEVVLGNEEKDSELVEAKLLCDLGMMTLYNGKERNEKEWAKLILSAGFSSYKVTSVLGLRSLIEVYP